MGFNLPLAELSARDRNKKVFIGIRGRPVREAGNITAI
jgi:hypothetical protein